MMQSSAGSSRLVKALVLFFVLIAVQQQGASAIYENCDVTSHYSGFDVENSSPDSLGPFLKTKHVNRLPYTSSTNPDVWDALIDLDPGASVSNTVRLIYTGTDVDANSYGTSSTWNREHLWPKSLGVGSSTSGYDYTDIHALRPSDWTVNSARGNKMFGECGVADVTSDCVSPAHPEAASTTSTDNVVWTPPSDVRGDIARAMFYMNIRYYGDGTDPDLQLVDCLNATNSNELGYLSILLKWHSEDPVSDAEIQRNDKACENWQGNRNPFVDFPDLVERFYGSPKPQPTDGQGYTCDNVSNERSDTPSAMPSSSPTLFQGCSASRCHLCDKANCRLLSSQGCKWRKKRKTCRGTIALSPSLPPPAPLPSAASNCPRCSATGKACCGRCVRRGKKSKRGCFERRQFLRA
jgi:endonuclease I